MRISLSLLVLPVLVGCATSLDDPTPRVAAPRVLAISSEPAEPLPNASTRLTALFADASGELSVAPLDWAYCTARKPLAELGPVARSCFDKSAADVHVAIGSGRSVVGRIPRETCRLFGPNPPPAMPGEPNQRPVDPDITGGYYQPVIAFRNDNAGDPTLAQVRVLCDVANGTPSAIAEFGLRYRANVNPSIAALTFGDEATPIPEDGVDVPPTIARGATTTLELSWPTCPDVGVCGDGICGDDETFTSCDADCLVPFGCDGAEHYVLVDPSNGQLVRRREGIAVTWYSTGGSFTEARTGRSDEDPETRTTNEFTAPAEAGDVVVFAVIRDERGGTSFRGFRLTVTP